VKLDNGKVSASHVRLTCVSVSLRLHACLEHVRIVKLPVRDSHRSQWRAYLFEVPEQVVSPRVIMCSDEKRTNR
jgi:hypothetical protein